MEPDSVHRFVARGATLAIDACPLHFGKGFLAEVSTEASAVLSAEDSADRPGCRCGNPAGSASTAIDPPPPFPIPFRPWIAAPAGSSVATQAQLAGETCPHSFMCNGRPDCARMGWRHRVPICRRRRKLWRAPAERPGVCGDCHFRWGSSPQPPLMVQGLPPREPPGRSPRQAAQERQRCLRRAPPPASPAPDRFPGGGGSGPLMAPPPAPWPHPGAACALRDPDGQAWSCLNSPWL